MANDSMPFAKEDGDKIVVLWHRIDVLVPEQYFSDPPLAEDLARVVEVLGFFDVRAFEKEGAKPRRFGFRLPARLRINYTETSVETDEDGDKVRVFSAFAGNTLIDDVNIVQSSDNVSALFRVMASARITGISYVELASMFIEGAKLNGANPGVTRTVLEAAISELVRWSKDPSTPLRIALASGKATESDLHLVKLKDLPRLNSVFTGVGFEDIQLAVQSGVRKTRSGEPERTSPMEELVRY